MTPLFNTVNQIRHNGTTWLDATLHLKNNPRSGFLSCFQNQVKPCQQELRPVAFWQDDAAEAEWFDITSPPSDLAFDHKLIIRKAFEYLLKLESADKTGKIQSQPLAKDRIRKDASPASPRLSSFFGDMYESLSL